MLLVNRSNISGLGNRIRQREFAEGFARGVNQMACCPSTMFRRRVRGCCVGAHDKRSTGERTARAIAFGQRQIPDLAEKVTVSHTAPTISHCQRGNIRCAGNGSNTHPGTVSAGESDRSSAASIIAKFLCSVAEQVDPR